MPAKIIKSIQRRIISPSSASGGNNTNNGGITNNTGDDTETIVDDELRLAFLGCEVLPPYGPCQHTAELFADLIASAWSSSVVAAAHSSSNEKKQRDRILVLEVYDVSRNTRNTNNANEEEERERFPSEDELRTNQLDGVILPGSFSSACDEETLWISELRNYIQTTLVVREIPTLGVCFGHQLYAHSFSGGGMACRCPVGPQAGRKITRLTPSGREFLAKGRDNRLSQQRSFDDERDGGLELFYTHGDMVESLPLRGVSLGGNDAVPIQAALYYGSQSPVPTTNTVRNNEFTDGLNEEDTLQDAVLPVPCYDHPKVIAVTFQAHPEFACLGGGGGHETLRKTMELMRDNGDLSDEDCVAALEDANASCVRVREQSLEVMCAAGRLLGWFGE